MCKQYSDIYASPEMRFILCCVKAACYYFLDIWDAADIAKDLSAVNHSVEGLEIEALSVPFKSHLPEVLW